MARAIAGLARHAVVRSQVALLAQVGVDDAIATVVRCSAANGAFATAVFLAFIALLVRIVGMAVTAEGSELARGGATTVGLVVILARAFCWERTGAITTVAFLAT